MSDTTQPSPDPAASPATTSAPTRATWHRIVCSPFVALITVGLAALIFVNVGNSARFNDRDLRATADHIRAQMNGSPADQIDRTVIPPGRSGGPNLIVYRGWTIHEADKWAMCLNTGEVDDDNETRHLTFTATDPYQIHDGACPTERTLTAPY